MATATARAKFLRVPPRKMRLVADLIRGKKVAEARDILAFTVKVSAPMLGKVLAAAVANAESKAAETRDRVDTDEMRITLVRIDGGPTLKRFRPAARGRATTIRRRTSHIELRISDE